MKTGKYKKELGAEGEKIAEKYLEKVKGYRIINKNYTCPFGEIDLIAYDGDFLVFIEVRSGSPLSKIYIEESIGFQKQKKLRQVASFYLKENNIYDCPCRFDVITLILDKRSRRLRELNLYRNAFV